MKKSIKISITLILMLAMLIIPNIAKANSESIILKKSDSEYLIYNESAMNEEFTFAFGEENTAKGSLIFFPSAKDSSEDGAYNVAYIDETTNAYLDENSEAFLFIRDKEGNYIVDGEKISLKDAVDKELVETTTKRIKVDTTQSNTTTATIDGVETEVTKGKVVITEKGKYSYVIMSVSTETESNSSKLMSLAEKIADTEELEKLDLMQKLELMKEFNTLYNQLLSNIKDSDWSDVENSEILQPENSKNGDKYIVFIKSEEGTMDAQFMTCYDKYNPLYEKETVTIKETSKLPVTYDSTITLIVIFAVIIVAIIVVLIIRKKVNKKEENK